jgi:hypothetical protein
MTAVSNTQPNRSKWRSFLFDRPKKDYWHPYFGAILLGIVLFLAFFITGNGLGASGGLNRVVVFVEDLFVPEHVDRVPYLIKLAGGDKNPLDDWIIPMVFGTLVGGFVSGWKNGRLQIETNKGPQISVRTRWLMAFIGGGLMGYGARMAPAYLKALSAAVLSVGRGLSCLRCLPAPTPLLFSASCGAIRLPYCFPISNPWWANRSYARCLPDQFRLWLCPGAPAEIHASAAILFRDMTVLR